MKLEPIPVHITSGPYAGWSVANGSETIDTLPEEWRWNSGELVYPANVDGPFDTAVRAWASVVARS